MRIVGDAKGCLTEVAPEKSTKSIDKKNEVCYNKTSGTVLEIGPGLGFLTSALLKNYEKVVAVELDEDLAAKLPGLFPGHEKDLEVVNEDILQFNLERLPDVYDVVANVPYYITSKIIKRFLAEAGGKKPRKMVLLVQKEVAERLAAGPGDLSILGVSAQIYASVSLGEVVRATEFTPPPKVDSQVVVFDVYSRDQLGDIPEKGFFRLVKIGFSSPRKKLVSNLAAGLKISKTAAASALAEVRIPENARPSDLGVDKWKELWYNLSMRGLV